MAEKMSAAMELWRHDDPQSTQMWKFLGHVNSKYSLKLKDYPTLYRWSVDNIAAFWEEVWDFTGITSSKRFDEVGTHVHSLILPPLPLFRRVYIRICVTPPGSTCRCSHVPTTRLLRRLPP